MNNLQIVLNDLDKNGDNIVHSIEFSNNVVIDWRSEAARNMDLYYQVSFRDRNQNSDNRIYYFINQLFVNNILEKNLDNLNSIIIYQNENEYIIDGINVFSIGTNNAEYGLEATIVLKDLDENTNLPFVFYSNEEPEE